MVEARVVNLHFRSVGTKIEEADNVRAVGVTCHRHVTAELFDSPLINAERPPTGRSFAFEVC